MSTPRAEGQIESLKDKGNSMRTELEDITERTDRISKS